MLAPMIALLPVFLACPQAVEGEASASTWDTPLAPASASDTGESWSALPDAASGVRLNDTGTEPEAWAPGSHGSGTKTDGP
jgi:hypothetical protein